MDAKISVAKIEEKRAFVPRDENVRLFSLLESQPFGSVRLSCSLKSFETIFD